jgi:hypothetical protein
LSAALAFDPDRVGRAGAGTSTRWSKSCGRCCRAYEAAQWESLPILEALAPATVQAHLSVPAAWTVELRRCACGAMLAIRSR